MSSRPRTVFVLLLGRSRSLSLRFVTAGALISLLTWLVGRLFPLGEFVVYRSAIAAVIVGILFLTGAGVIAYRNSGFLIALSVLVIVLLSLFTSGGVAVYPEYGLIDRLRMVLMVTVVIAVPLSVVGFVVGAVLRRIR